MRKSLILKRLFDLVFVIAAIALLAFNSPELADGKNATSDGEVKAASSSGTLDKGGDFNPLKLARPEAYQLKGDAIEAEKKWQSLIDGGEQAFNRGDNESALQYFLQAYEVARPMGASYEHTAIAFAARARLRLAQYDKALSDMQLALESAGRLPHPQRPHNIFADQLIVASILHSSGRTSEALAKLNEAEDFIALAYTKTDGFYRTGIDQLADMHRKYGDNEGADRLMSKLQ